jgi:hypothetical protein
MAIHLLRDGEKILCASDSGLTRVYTTKSQYPPLHFSEKEYTITSCTLNFFFVNIFLFGVGSFGYSMLTHIGDNHDHIVYAYEKDEFTLNFLKKFSRHPYFFE